MSDAALESLAQEAGLLVRWTDANGIGQKAGADTLRSVLRALEIPAESPAQIKESRTQLRRHRTGVPPLIVARAGEALPIPGSVKAELVSADGTRIGLQSRHLSSKPANLPPGYYQLEADGELYRIAIAPKRCLTPRDMAAGRKLSGISLQIYSLRDGTNGSFGDFAALGRFARNAGRVGFDAVMASPAHAQFGADPGRFTPYSPSTRLFANPLFADPGLEGVPPGKYKGNSGELINWHTAGGAKFGRLRRAFSQFRKRGNKPEFESFCREGGERLLAHALFEALDGALRTRGFRGFRNWPSGFDSPQSPAVRAFARASRTELMYQLYLQWLATRSLAQAQALARQTMQIGIIADIAVGMDQEGSHAWSAPRELLRGLNVGAPPDAFNQRGQDWGITTLSPRALVASGFAPFVATVRAGMRHAGGVRIDHVMGLRRLWVIPEGASPREGAYLRYPQRELFNLLALESHLNRAIVIGEDLGTVPEGFRGELAAMGILGMQVLWFERDSRGEFASPAKWRRDAVAMTTTHDLPTVAGWWRGHDIGQQKRAGFLHGNEHLLHKDRARERKKLWSAFGRAECATTSAPLPSSPDPAVGAALRFVARTRAAIAFAPLEDIEGSLDQPNLPGTTSEHPNWRRRTKSIDVLRRKKSRERAKEFVAARRIT